MLQNSIKNEILIHEGFAEESRCCFPNPNSMLRNFKRIHFNFIKSRLIYFNWKFHKMHKEFQAILFILSLNTSSIIIFSGEYAKQSSDVTLKHFAKDP